MHEYLDIADIRKGDAPHRTRRAHPDGVIGAALVRAHDLVHLHRKVKIGDGLDEKVRRAHFIAAYGELRRYRKKALPRSEIQS